MAGQQGLVRFVIAPRDQARDRAAYDRQIQLLCEPDRTCFLNFYTNSTGAPLAVPLPDAIDHEATAVFRRSAKRGRRYLPMELPFADPASGLFLSAPRPAFPAVALQSMNTTRTTRHS